MTLRTKILIVLGATLAGLGVILYATLEATLMQGFKALEEQQVNQNLARVLAAVADDLSNLNTTAQDWSEWDDTYAFVINGNESYIASNLGDATFSSLQLNVIVFLDTTGRLIFSKGFDLETSQVEPISANLQEHLSSNDPLTHHPDPTSSITGILPLKEGPLLIASRPILTSERTGPIRGTLIMGRYLDLAKVNDLAQRTQLSLAIHPVHDPAMPSDFQAVQGNLLQGMAALVRPLSERDIAGYSLVKDIYGNPGLVLRVDEPRAIYAQGKIVARYVVFSLLAIVLIFGALTLFLLERWVLAPVAGLNAGVRRIAASSDPSARIRRASGYELASLASSINRMLEALERSQHKQLESEERHRDLFENASDGIYTLDRQGRFTSFNRRAEELTGYTRSELLGQPYRRLVAAHQWRQARNGFISNLRGETHTFELSIVHKEGHEVVLELSTRPLIESNETIGVQGIARDITERKELERLKEEFLSMVSHDLRTPLTSIQGYTDLILAGDIGSMTAEQQEFLGIIRQNTIRLARLADDILDIERLESKRVQFQAAPLNLTEVLREVVKTFRVNALEKNLELRIDLEPDLHVRGDRERLIQAFGNLLSNAIKYTAQGSVVVQASSEIGHAVVKISDTGVGVSPEDVKHVFEKFFRGSHEYVHRSVGTGLGLAIVKAIIDHHGGTIDISSQLDQGSTFLVRLPLMRSETAAP